MVPSTSIRRSTLQLLLLLTGVASLAACNKSKNEAPPSLAASAAPAAAASAAAAPSESAAAAPTIPPPIAPGATPAAEPNPAKEKEKAAQAASKGFGECCKALHKQLDALPPSQQGKLKAAAMSCDGIAKLVESGKTAPKDAYTSLRAALGGGALPAGCK
jgi:hypothetical protein